MKFALSIAAALIATSASAYTCNQLEAQFIGKVTSARVHKIDQGVRDCYIKIEFEQYNPHGFCPIDQSIAESAEILDYDCRYDLKVGAPVSGYLNEGKDYGQIVLE